LDLHLLSLIIFKKNYFMFSVDGKHNCGAAAVQSIPSMGNRIAVLQQCKAFRRWETELRPPQELLK
jgi:hypothetical protein